MIILSIETSCDETAVSLVCARGGLTEPRFDILANTLWSQTDIHTKYGGVFPMMAKREHSRQLPYLLKEVLSQAHMFEKSEINHSENIWKEVEKILDREKDLYQSLREILSDIKKPNIDLIAVTEGPGLEPALWVGVSCAKALSALWNIPVRGVNHMKGHITSVLFDKNFIEFPALALLISGGHTELVDIQTWGQYKILGQTRDDAVGESFDKVARMLGLPYPGGPEISKLAEISRKSGSNENIPKFPRPMIHSPDLDFSFSGLKTAVLYYLRDHGPIGEKRKMDIARDFEDSVIEVLLHKTKKALLSTGAKTLIVGGGVSANQMIRQKFSELPLEFSDLKVLFSSKELSTDNALMIASAAYIDFCLNPETRGSEIKAVGNLSIEQ